MPMDEARPGFILFLIFKQPPLKGSKMNLNSEILSKITIHSKYAKYIPNLNRRETWAEVCDRYEDMMIKKYPDLKEEIIDNMVYVRDKKVLPSMRGMQFAGSAIQKNNSRVYNCAYLPIDDYRSFSEVMFLLLGGTGVGYSVQRHHVARLPEIRKPQKEMKYVIGDSIEGWSDAVRHLISSYLSERKTKPRFDYSDIREKGEQLITAGGKAPGPEPLKICLTQIEAILNEKEDGDRLSPLECHDILCHIANAVLAGGIRRAAMISLFSYHDQEMLTCKYGNWHELNEQRGRANNSVVILRHKIREEDFFELWKKIELSNSGEPGIYFSNDKEWGTNPCCEIALRPFQFCNLCEINVSDVEDQEELEARSSVAAFLGTLQAGFTDFHYLRDEWKRTTEREALIGVGMTGIGSGRILGLNLKKAANVAKKVNKDLANEIGINSAARVTTVKPSGTTSCVLGTSSGIHAWHDEHYVRRIKVGKEEALYSYLKKIDFELMEDDYFKPTMQSVISIPQKAPEGAILRDETAIELLERVKKFNVDWVKQGHKKGSNTNNVSATISIKDGEWEDVGLWMWMNKEAFNGLAVLPHDGGTYVQSPFETITEEEYNKMEKQIISIDLNEVLEQSDNTTFTQEAACAGGSCSV